ncbi:hypothetical protein UFOVP190_273 [uncultured Caudovirales phage]|uniref:Uncharacterized protein n=1 Tax=uncultured Caudovirales phage TaxID=2100421 RepID=A0A6J7WPF2_9CAUD|nr:hypothetical protein UFOVP190_273 [uncultured Caudovirales phage]
MTPLPPAFSEMYERMAYRNHPVVKLTGELMNMQVWLMLNIWFLPYKLPGMLGDIEEVVRSVTLNGIKSSNPCKPNVRQ